MDEFPGESSGRSQKEALAELEQTLYLFYRSLTRSMSSKIEPGSPPMGQLLLLSRVARGLNTVSELARRLQITPAAVSKMVESLVQAGCLTRSQLKGDRRVAPLEVTPLGQDILSKHKQNRAIVIAEAFAGLSEEEIITLTALLKKSLAERGGGL